MSNKNQNIMIIAGEASGDLHGAVLISELKKLNPDLDVSGIGGDKMKTSGMDLIYHIKKMAFLGFAEVIKHIPFIKKVQSDLLNIIDEKKIEHVVLIDYPGFNLNFAKKLKAKKVKIIYYISPQIWAWGSGRIKKIKQLVNKMLVVFPFEEDLYKKANVNVEFVGHPLLERIEAHNFLEKENLFKELNLDVKKEILLLLPGSRKDEIAKIFPESIKAAGRLADEFNLQIVVACSHNIDEEIFYGLSDKKNFKVTKNFIYDLMEHSKIGIIKSGTSTLEAALFELPMVIVYKTSALTFFIGKNLIKVKNIGMANIISGEQIVPELIQNDVNEDSIFNECKKLLSDENYYKSVKEKLKNVKGLLGTSGASARAAKSIYAMLNETQEN
jgi:lipid-A-disaccharide synthase